MIYRDVEALLVGFTFWPATSPAASLLHLLPESSGGSGARAFAFWSAADATRRRCRCWRPARCEQRHELPRCAARWLVRQDSLRDPSPSVFPKALSLSCASICARLRVARLERALDATLNTLMPSVITFRCRQRALAAAAFLVEDFRNERLDRARRTDLNVFRRRRQFEFCGCGPARYRKRH